MLKLKEFITCTIRIFAVRLKEFNELENTDPYGTMLWPEVLICSNKIDAQKLLKQLEGISLNMFKKFYAENFPDEIISEDELFNKWKNEDYFQYIIEQVDDLKEYENLYRIGESEVAYEKVLRDDLSMQQN